eukprot:8154725-Pyramimonas_sp.AAC.2
MRLFAFGSAIRLNRWGCDGGTQPSWAASDIPSTHPPAETIGYPSWAWRSTKGFHGSSGQYQKGACGHGKGGERSKKSQRRRHANRPTHTGL